MKTGARKRGWCQNCGDAVPWGRFRGVDGRCPVCGDELRPMESLSDVERPIVEMQDWFEQVCKAGLNGPSPIDAAAELGCHRSMIDKLVGMGVLERSMFVFKGQKIVIISSRSIKGAKENRKRTGNWTGYPVNRGA